MNVNPLKFYFKMKEVRYMISYSELFTFIIMLCAVITVTKNNKKK